jgi:type 2 lantibiotic biosynthesis protein LanM
MVARAASLRERITLFREHPGWFDGTAPEVDARLQEWSRLSTAGVPGHFERRLAYEGFDRQSVRPVLGPLTLPADVPRPGWLDTVRDVLAEIGQGGWSEFALEEPPFEPYWRPWVHVARGRLVRQAGRLWSELGENVRAEFASVLLSDLARTGARCLMHEFNVYRFSRLSGNDYFMAAIGAAESRGLYEGFLRSILGTRSRAFLETYPCLARLSATRLAFWVDQTKELLQRLDADRGAIEACFSDGRPLPPLSQVSSGLSDSHNGGRVVTVLRFGDRAIVYKPKDLSCDLAWNALLGRVAAEGGPALRALKVLERRGYGWVEFLEARAAPDGAAERRYAERCGELLATVHILLGSDCHSENLLASEDQPVLVDMETLLTPTPAPGAGASPADQLFTRLISRSVLRTGFLPGWTMASRRRKLDESGFGAGEDVSGQRILRFTKPGTDFMSIEVVTPDGPAMPQAPAILDPEPVVEGFRRTYRFFWDRASTLTGSGGMFAPFRNVRVRFVPRATTIYVQLLQESRTPELMADGLARGMSLDRLASAFLTEGDPPPTWPVHGAEVDALFDGDIPFFNAASHDTRIYAQDPASGEGVPLTPPCFDETPFCGLERGVAELSLEDQEWQVRCIEGSFAAKLVTEGGMAEPPGERDTSPEPFDADSARSAALEVARSLAENVIVARDGAEFRIGLDLDVDAGVFHVGVLGSTLYAGQPGISLFLAGAFAASGDLDLHRAALAGLQHLRGWLREAPESVAGGVGLGGFAGLGGLIYSFVQVGRLLGEPALVDDAESLASAISPEMIASDTSYDVVAGAAGCILALCALYAETGSVRALERIEALGRHLLARASTQPVGIGWSDGYDAPLCGMAHGNAGIALALMRAWQRSGRREFRDTALAALERERSLRDDRHGNWPDLRGRQSGENGGDPELMSGWCHGAPGIGLARVALLAVEDLPGAREDLAVAVASTRGISLSALHTCCGMAGIDEILFEIGRRVGDASLCQQAQQQAMSRIARAAREGWRTHPGFPHRVAVPGFMQGIAGIGYGLLRMSASELALPCVLDLSA